MAFNVLSGTISHHQLIASGTFSGSFEGDGASLTNVSHRVLYGDYSAGRLTFFKTVDGETHLEGDANLAYNTTTDTLSLVRLTASSGINFPGLAAGIATTGSFLAIDSNNNLVLTSSATARGPLNSVQFHTQGGTISGSSGLLYNNVILSVSGSGSVAGEAIAVTGALIPGANNVYDLGAPNRQWKSLYVSSSTIYFGGEPLSVKDGSLKFGSGSSTKSFRVGHLELRNNSLSVPSGNVFTILSEQTKFFGGVAYKRRVVADDYTILKSNCVVAVQSDTITASVKLTLPSANTCENGQTFIIKDEGGNAHTHNIVISASSTDTIDGQGSIRLESAFSALNLYTNGSNKFFIY